MMKMGTLVVAFGAMEKTMSQRKKSLKPKPPHGRAAGSGSGRVPSAFGWQLLVTGGLRVGAAGVGASMTLGPAGEAVAPAFTGGLRVGAAGLGAFIAGRAGPGEAVALAFRSAFRSRLNPNMVRKSQFGCAKK